MKVPTHPSPTPPESSPLAAASSADELRAALDDARVAGALHLALRNVQLRARFASLRAKGLTVEAAVEQWRGPHVYVSGHPYYLSDERIRGIVYEKG